MTAGDAYARIRRSVEDDRTVAAVVGLTLFAILARLVFLGHRIAHWDEGRVGYWTLRYMESGAFEYRPIVHGPFLPIVNETIFGVVGPSDFSARLIVALVGGLLPLGALLFRTHLRDTEIVALAFFFALNPVLLYYSRFMRNDVLVAAFMLLAFGFFLRAYETRSVGYLYAGTASTAFGFATKENALLYLLCWIGAAALIVDHALFRPSADESGIERITALWDEHGRRFRDDAGTIRTTTLLYGGHLLLSGLLFFAIIVFFYAPRVGTDGGVGLWQAFGRPGLFPDVIHSALVESTSRGWESWFGRSTAGEDLVGGYRETLGSMIRILLYGAGAVFTLSLVGFVAERYGRRRSRWLVMFASYWGFASLLGYPLVASVGHPAWLAAHVIVPLAIPAAVGLALVVGWGLDARESGDEIGVALAAVLVVILVGGMVATAVDTSYANPQSHDNVMVQYAQPEGEMQPALADARTAIENNEGVDVLFYGEMYYLEDESVADQPTVGPGEWFSRLPLPWYTEMYGAEVSSATTPAQLDAELGDDPPVVIAQYEEAEDVADRLDDRYEAYGAYDLRGPEGPQYVVIYVDQSKLE